ncbi:hypothetical protein C8A03DRAFT_13022 [Achaetomium macrosporum]|uniref:Uncharacterized protein n=1 Tax=Achaetomium macrosporum TaxID=79813 RepID=A0AAN7CEM8_9PEZI|nr:hypothetical protein C8A03DRAFT_13022 [Achaetomium macrosporum]
MKGVIKTAVTAAVIVGVAAQPHNHGHRHLHKKHDQSPAQKRDVVIVTEVVQGPTVVEYVTPDGETLDPAQAEADISKGVYYVVGSSVPTFSAPPPAVTTSKASAEFGAQFYEKTTSTSISTSTSTSTSTTTTSAKPSSTKASSPAQPSATGLDADFPSGKVDCDKVPTEYGAIEVPWVGTAGWTTLAKFGSFIKGVSVDDIESPVDGTCGPGMMCSYACPPGYQKTQWPVEQGARGQSVGGLWCNEEGKLELTRPKYTKLCEPGEGGVYVRNELKKNSAICRTDYPGCEAMVIPLDTYPGSTYPLTNPDQNSYYVWQGKLTTAQYYVNNEGVPVEEACTWKSSQYPDSAGNWAPTNIGVGKSGGVTYLSIFPNKPTSTATLNYDIAIEVDGKVQSDCWLKSGQYSKPDGCTVGVPSGSTATIVLKHSS